MEIVLNRPMSLLTPPVFDEFRLVWDFFVCLFVCTATTPLTLPKSWERIRSVRSTRAAVKFPVPNALSQWTLDTWMVFWNGVCVRWYKYIRIVKWLNLISVQFSLIYFKVQLGPGPLRCPSLSFCLGFQRLTEPNHRTKLNANTLTMLVPPSIE